jgi:hypothetical protein
MIISFQEFATKRHWINLDSILEFSWGYKITKNIRWGSRCHGYNLNRVPTEYKSEAYGLSQFARFFY